MRLEKGVSSSPGAGRRAQRRPARGPLHDETVSAKRPGAISIAARVTQKSGLLTETSACKAARAARRVSLHQLDAARTRRRMRSKRRRHRRDRAGLRPSRPGSVAATPRGARPSRPRPLLPANDRAPRAERGWKSAPRRRSWRATRPGRARGERPAMRRLDEAYRFAPSRRAPRRGSAAARHSATGHGCSLMRGRRPDARRARAHAPAMPPR